VEKRSPLLSLIRPAMIFATERPSQVGSSFDHTPKVAKPHPLAAN
jgi:hypothetical protein